MTSKEQPFPNPEEVTADLPLIAASAAEAFERAVTAPMPERIGQYRLKRDRRDCQQAPRPCRNAIL